MCGIVGAVAQRDVQEILLEGLRRLEYRGYDSAGVAVCQSAGGFGRVRTAGKVSSLASRLTQTPLAGGTGIAHTRWATHGAPTETNAHPHESRSRVLVVHNGIVENFAELKEQLIARGARFSSDTDTEVIAHLVAEQLESGATLLEALRRTKSLLKGTYGTVIMDVEDPSRLVGARSGSPLVVGIGLGENFVASDPLALFPVTRRFVYLEEGELVEITRNSATLYSADGEVITREPRELLAQADAADKGRYRHFMQKEIFEQPRAVHDTLEGRLQLDPALLLGDGGAALASAVERVQIIACGTSYHAGLTARYWFEALADLPCDVEIASEFRYRRTPRPKNALLIVISQSGETADTLAALRQSAGAGYLATLAICNVANSSLVREAGRALLTRAGTEIGVASTKAFTTQLAALATVVLTLAKVRGADTATTELAAVLAGLPAKLEAALGLDSQIEALAEEFAGKQHALFLGRGEQYPIAMEGALKLKEISYIHAEAYAAGELKHGPLALIDAEMPVIVVAPNDQLLEKLKSNIEEVRARGGILYVFADVNAGFRSDETLRVINLPHVDHPIIAPMVYTVALQLLAYHVAVIRGTDVDQPRNLAKSVTVE